MSMKIKSFLRTMPLVKILYAFYRSQRIKNSIVLNSGQKIVLTSYTCSGVSWLINCFIELGIRVEPDYNPWFKYKRTYDNTFSEYEMLSVAEQFKVGLPALTFKKKFLFTNNISCHFMEHCCPELSVAKKFKTILMVRDPRDAIWSNYNYNINYVSSSFQDFAELRIREWKRFYQVGLTHPNTGFFRFEDYKADPIRHLENILKFCEIECSHEDIKRAVSNSTSEKSKKAEQMYISKTTEEEREFKLLFNRSGKTNQWKNVPEHHDTFVKIQKEAEDLMKVFNYELI